MKKLQILNTRELKEIKKALTKQFNFKGKLPYVFLISPRNRLYIINKDLSRIDLNKLGTKIDSLGLYFGEYKNTTIRLSMEGSILIAKHSSKNILELTDPEIKKWLKGEDLFKDLGKKSKFIILKHKKDILGCGRYKQERIFNYVPKERRMRVFSN